MFDRYFHDEKNVYLMLEYLPNGELFRTLRKSGGTVGESVCRTYMLEVCSAVAYMHSRQVMHRDIKPENILIASDGKLKLGDLGWAVHAPAPHSVRYTFCGTPEYVSPEMISGAGHTLAVDLWAMGVLMYEMLFGRYDIVW